MLTDDVVTDVQPQTCASLLRGKKWIKHKRQRLFGDQRTRIVEIDAHALSILAGVQVYRDPARLVCFHRFDGVQAQVDENLFEPVASGLNCIGWKSVPLTPFHLILFQLGA